MLTIHKYPLQITNEPKEISLPFGARALSAIEQNDGIVLYCLVNGGSNQTTIRRRFVVYGTGWEIDIRNEYLEFISTVKIGDLVFHVFEIEELPF